MMSGYYRNPEATAAITTDDGWIDSGDLGYLANRELFLTGRHKAVIIKAGRNVYPHEAEAIVASIDGVRKGCVAVFGVVVSIYYYFCIIRAMYWSRETPDESPVAVAWPTRVALGLCVAAILYLGLLPNKPMNWANTAAKIEKRSSPDAADPRR